MPSVRSFSELELSANSAAKLNLICLAQCEPICSIDWQLNGQPLFPANPNQPPFPSPTIKTIVSGSGDSLTGLNQTSAGLVMERVQKFDFHHLGSFSAFESLIYRKNESQFTWLSESSLGEPVVDLPPSLSANGAAQMRHSYANQANVFSKLELTYHQIGQLLARSPEEQIHVKCKLNTMLGGKAQQPTRSPPAGGGAAAKEGPFGQAEGELAAEIANGETTRKESPTELGYALIEPSRWFPEGADETEEWGHQFGMSNEPLNLTALNYQSRAELVNKGPHSTRVGALLVPVGAGFDGGLLHLQSRSQSQASQSELALVDEMQISILLDSEYWSPQAA